MSQHCEVAGLDEGRWGSVQATGTQRAEAWGCDTHGLVGSSVVLEWPVGPGGRWAGAGSSREQGGPVR